MLLAADISSVPADFVKYFAIMLAFVAGLYLAHRKGTQATGTKEEPVNVAQPLEVKRSAEYAHKNETQSELKKLDDKMEAMARENLRQHNTQGGKLADVITAGAERENTILRAIHDMEHRVTTAMLKEMKDIHERLNPIGEAVNGHAATIKAHESRLAEMWQWINKLWEHVTKRKGG